MTVGYRRFNVVEWYPKVLENPSTLGDAIEYYDRAIADARKCFSPRGEVQELLADQAGIEHFYESIRDDAAKIVAFYEKEIKQLRARKHKWYLTSEEANRQYGDKLKPTEVKAFVDSDREVQTLDDDAFYISMSLRSLNTLIEKLRQRGIYLSMIAKLRASNQHEIFIDASRPTDSDY